jgi:lipopolysaccharide biosynthesis glycosyltransferase
MSEGPVVVLAADEGYGVQLATTLRSLVEANRTAPSLDIRVLTTGVSERTKAMVAASLPPGAATIQWVRIDLEPFQGFSRLDHVSAMTYARLLLAQAVQDGVSKVLYLDSDILVLDDLWDLWNIDLHGAIVGAVIDALDGDIKSGMPGLEDVARVKAYFNAGVLLVDVNLWRSERVAERAFDYLSRNRQQFMDQDALNAVCDGRWHQLDARWNYQNHYSTDFGALPVEQRPAIVHFVTRLKPWLTRTLSPNAAFYDSFQSRTAFALTSRVKTSKRIARTWFQLRRYLGRSTTLRVCRDRMFGRPPVARRIA